MRNESERDGRPAARWPGRGNLTTISFVAFLVGAVAIGSTAIRIAERFDDSVTVRLAAQSPVSASDVDGAASLIRGTYTSASVEVAGLSIGPRLMLAGGDLMLMLTVCAVAASVMYLCYRLMRRTPFTPSLIRMLSLAAWALIVGGAGSQVLAAGGRLMAAAELNESPPQSAFPFTATGSYWPLAIGIGLRLVVAAFQIGEREQRNAAATHAEAARLRRDAEGLV